MKPILFSTPMVQAIMDGRKTMTRRVIKDVPSEYDFTGRVIATNEDNRRLKGCLSFGFDNAPDIYISPLYEPGDVLWVRETWQTVPSESGDGYAYVYKASDNGQDWQNNTEGWTWRPSIFMPKKATRIFLKVKGVWAERVQEISREDVIGEGFRINSPAIFSKGYKGAFQLLWDSLNAKRGYGWDSNPWVWVISFERCYKPEQED